MSASSKNKLVCTVLLAVITLGGSSCTKPRPNSTDNSAPSFDYYLLTLSWAPEFCATHSNASASECDPGRRYGFVVHGLWPQNEDGSYPQHCAPAQPVAQDTVRRMLAIMPDRGLIQHEWAAHGTCSDLDSQGYFEAMEKAFGQLHVPADYRAATQPFSISPAEIEQKFAAANHAPRSTFRVSCSSSQLIGMEVCLTKDLAYRQCGQGVRECRAPMVNLRPLP